MEFIETTTLSAQQKAELFGLWNNEYPLNLNYDGISGLDTYLSNLSDQSHVLLIDAETRVAGWGFTFLRDNEKWFAIILNTAIQKMGYGRMLLNKLKEREQALSGWVIDHNRDKKTDGSYYQSPLGFYLKNDFTVMPDYRLELGKISAVKIQWHK